MQKWPAARRAIFFGVRSVPDVFLLRGRRANMPIPFCDSASRNTWRKLPVADGRHVDDTDHVGKTGERQIHVADDVARAQQERFVQADCP